MPLNIDGTQGPKPYAVCDSCIYSLIVIIGNRIDCTRLPSSIAFLSTATRFPGPETGALNLPLLPTMHRTTVPVAHHTMGNIAAHITATVLRIMHDKPPTNLGFKVLAEGDQPVVDIVAIHGLDGDREKTWKAENEILWLRDLLPDDVPNARILTYGYDSATRGRMQLSNQSIHGHAEDLINRLVVQRKGTQAEDRPIIFIAHSLGGIILKYALLIANAANDQHLAERNSIATSTSGLIFLGTPHQGADSADLMLRILKIYSLARPTNTKVAQHLTPHSETLQDLLSAYNAISPLYKTVFFYETYATPLPFGLTQVLVERHTAVVPGVVNAPAIGLNKSHTGMSKFDSREDDDYMTVTFYIKTLVKNAVEKGGAGLT